MFTRILATSFVLCAACHAGVRSGKATADLLAASNSYQPGQPLQVAIKLAVDPGWHTYWVNPGEGGMKLSVKWTLPPGWTAGEVGYPVPKTMSTGGLAGYGHEGTVLFPVTLTPGPDATGEVKPEVEVSWLTCSDDACVPGKAMLSLTTDVGQPGPTADTPAIEAALAAAPRAVDGLKLEVAESGKFLDLTLNVPPKFDIDAAKAKVFPETVQAVDPKAKIEFSKRGKTWTARVAKNEYATTPLKELTLVISGAHSAARVTWAKTP